MQNPRSIPQPVSAIGLDVGGPHRAGFLQTERYLLTCMHYMELNPVGAQVALLPAEYRWSSHGANAWGESSWLSPHLQHQPLGTTWAYAQY